jgi:hypothetical protein
MNPMIIKKELYFFFFLLMTISIQLSGQNIILPDGEYMDTTSVKDTGCLDRNIYYYQVGGKYPESSSSLLKKAVVHLKNKNEVYSGSGYITFRFRIDCEGKIMKNAQVLQTDEKYVGSHFEKKLVNELWDFTRQLNKWKIAKSPKGSTYSYTTFITFKIKDGKINNIIP